MSDFSDQDQLIVLISAALGHARLFRDQICNVVIPALPPQLRSFAEQIQRRIGEDEMFQTAFLRDLEAFNALLKREVEKGTQTAWIADNDDVHGGHSVCHRDDRALALNCSVGDLVDLDQAIRDVMDHVKAARLVEDMIGD